MSSYEPPISRLLELGRPRGHDWDDYLEYGIGPEHIPDLIRLMQDRDLLQWGQDEEPPRVYAGVHAWRALGQLKAEAAIEPLLDLILENDADDFSDWVIEEVPEVLGMIGLPALAPTAERLEQFHFRPFSPGSFARVLERIAGDFPETRTHVIEHLVAFLDHARQNDPGQNGIIISSLIKLKAVEAWPAIERAFISHGVDPMIVGDANMVRFQLGLGPEPPRRERRIPRTFASSPKERAEDRARKRKAEKRKQNRNR
jgi:hypothetical protein